MKFKLVATSQIKPVPQEESDYQSLKANQLLAEYDQLKAWLIGHESKSGTRNMFDVEGRAYDARMWEQKLHQLESVEDEGRRRGLAGFLSEAELLSLLDPPPPTPTSLANQPGDSV
jgi:hypothetical protein